jgi:hypothetical protein
MRALPRRSVLQRELTRCVLIRRRPPPASLCSALAPAGYRVVRILSAAGGRRLCCPVGGGGGRALCYSADLHEHQTHQAARCDATIIRAMWAIWDDFSSLLWRTHSPGTMRGNGQGLAVETPPIPSVGRIRTRMNLNLDRSWRRYAFRGFEARAVAKSRRNGHSVRVVSNSGSCWDRSDWRCRRGVTAGDDRWVRRVECVHPQLNVLPPSADHARQRSQHALEAAPEIARDSRPTLLVDGPRNTDVSDCCARCRCNRRRRSTKYAGA